LKDIAEDATQPRKQASNIATGDSTRGVFSSGCGPVLNRAAGVAARDVVLDVLTLPLSW